MGHSDTATLHYTTLKNALVQYTTVKCSRYVKYQPNNKAKWANSSCFTMPDKVHNHVWNNHEHNKLHYTTIHYTLLYYTTLHFIKLHYTTLVYGKLLSFEAKLTHKSVPLSCVKKKKYYTYLMSYTTLKLWWNNFSLHTLL